MVKNLNSGSEIFKEMMPAWKKCSPVKAALGKEDFNRMYQFMTVFADPSKYDLYKASKHALGNWPEIT